MTWNLHANLYSINHLHWRILSMLALYFLMQNLNTSLFYCGFFFSLSLLWDFWKDILLIAPLWLILLDSWTHKSNSSCISNCSWRCLIMNNDTERLNEPSSQWRFCSPGKAWKVWQNVGTLQDCVPREGAWRRRWGRSKLSHPLVMSFDLFTVPNAAEKRKLTQATLTVSVRGLKHRLGGCLFLPLWPPHGEAVFCHSSPHTFMPMWRPSLYQAGYLLAESNRKYFNQPFISDIG